MRFVILVAFFVSGLCALIYEVVWVRLLGLVMGNTVYAVSTTLAAFMAGLALGSYFFGRLADRLDRPGRFYGTLELLIGVYCVALPVLIAAADPLYGFVYSKLSASFGVMTAVRFFTAGFVLLVPAVLMGATLPVLSRLYASHRERLGWEIGKLYAVNTWGAVAGTLLAGFVLLPGLGVRTSLVAAAAANVSIGLVVLGVTRHERSRRLREIPQEPAPEATVPVETPSAHAPEGPFRTVALAFAVSGMAALIYEVAWTRTISLLIGPSAYAFSLMLACFLIGLALGSALGARWIDRRREKSVRVMGLLLVAVAALALVFLPVLSGAAPVVREITRKYSQSFGLLYASYFGLVALVILPPTIVLGAVFPAAVSAAAPGLRYVGRRVGLLYSGNTIGAIGGSVIGGFALIPAMGLEKSIAVAAVCHLAAACLLFIKGREVRYAGFAALVGILGLVFLPRWDVDLLNSGPYAYLYSGKDAARSIVESRKLVYYKEGVTATVAVVKGERQLALTIDGKVDASIGADMDTQIMLADLPLLLSEEPQQALIIGLASGVTLGSAERHPELENIDCVEISPEVIEACDFFKDYNYNALTDPRLNLIVHDARNYLKLSDRKYDVIISEPSNPWMSGASALFTREFFEECLSHLNERGIMCQWLQAYNIPLPLVKSVVATFCDVFPNVSLWMPLKGDVILLGSSSEFRLDPGAITRRISRPELRRDLLRMNLTNWQELAGFYLGGGSELCGEVKGLPLQTDDRPTLEFTLPKTFHSGIESALEILSWLSMRRDDFALQVEGGAEAKEEARLSATSYKDFLQASADELGGNLDEALALYESALSGAGGRRVALDPMYLLLCRKGLDAERKDQADTAAELYRKATTMSPDRGEARYLLGLYLMDKQRFPEAVEELKVAVARDSLRIQPALALIEALSAAGRHAEAIRAWQRAVRLAPADANTWYGAARVYARAGDIDEAKRALDRAAAIAGTGLLQRAAADPVLASVAPQANPPARAGSPTDSVKR